MNTSEEIEDVKIKPIKNKWFYFIKTYIKIMFYSLKYK
jgi:hypothetical protein